jgi:hypothetical protein
MELSINDEKTKEIITEIIIELLQTRKELFSEIIKETLEEVALANAIIEGRKNDFVSEEEIFNILDNTEL